MKWIAVLAVLVVAARDATAVPFPGPDGFGYTGIEIPLVLRYVSTTGTAVPLDDDELSAPLPIGFSFAFYGVSYDTFRISSNGFITLGPAPQNDGCCTGGLIPSPSSANNLIAGWWEDFNAPPGNIRFQTVGEPGSRELVVGFYRVAHFFNGPRVIWEIVLRENTNQIEIHCAPCLSDGGFHTIGIENATGTDGLQVVRTTNSLGPVGFLLSAGEPPDCGTCFASPATLWPPNGRLVEVSIDGVVDLGDAEVAIRIDSIRQDEPLALTTESKNADALGIGAAHALLRAERRGDGDGRVYHVGFTATDEDGRLCAGVATVCVPHGQGGCIDGGAVHDSTTPPSLDSSDPPAGRANVPRTAWIRFELTQPLAGPSPTLECDGVTIPAALHLPEPKVAILNPDPDLPTGAVCSVQYLGAAGPEEFLFGVADGEASATVIYDRIDALESSPFPDDYWLVENPGESGQRIQLDLDVTGIPLADSVALAISDAIADRDGFSPIQPFVVGLSDAPDTSNLLGDAFDSVDPFTPIALYDMDPASPDYGSAVPFAMELRDDVAPDKTRDHTALLFPGVRLRPGGTYSLVVTRRLFPVGEPGRPFGPSGFFDAVAGGGTSAGGEVDRARTSIEPVLAFLESVPAVPVPREDVALALRVSIRGQAFDASDILAIRETILALPPPLMHFPSRVGGFGRAAIIRGTVLLPSFLVPNQVGRLNRDPMSGLPVPAGVESVPFVLSLPNASLAGPVPIVFYQHGNPGSPEEITFPFNEFLDDAGYALIGIQNVRNRRFGPNLQRQAIDQLLALIGSRHFPLFDLQSYADMWSLLRAIEPLGNRSFLPLLAPDAVPEIDPSRILFRGIGFGAHYSLAFLPLAPEVTAAVSVAGAGRYFEQTIRQFAPADFASLGARPRVLLAGFAALQNDMDRQDSHLLARNLYREPLSVGGEVVSTPPSLLWLEGIGDSLVTNNSTRAAANELGIPLVRPAPGPTRVLQLVDAPLAGNIDPDTTGGHFQYDPGQTPSCESSVDGHFCPQIALEAEAQILRFFETALDGAGAPEIIDPFQLAPAVRADGMLDAELRFGRSAVDPAAKRHPPGCGLGFELALVLLPLMSFRLRRFAARVPTT